MIQDTERVEQIYRAALKLVPHKKFTFAKLWRQFSEFKLRETALEEARKIMGLAIGLGPKEKIFKDYIELELKLREFDRCRILYEKWLEVRSSYLCPSFNDRS